MGSTPLPRSVRSSGSTRSLPPAPTHVISIGRFDVLLNSTTFSGGVRLRLAAPFGQLGEFGPQRTVRLGGFAPIESGPIGISSKNLRTRQELSATTRGRSDQADEGK